MGHPDSFSVLGWFERFAFRTMRSLNQGACSAIGWFWQRSVITPLIGLLVNRRLTIHGHHHLDALPADAPVLLVANHRTFFDLFVLGWVFMREPKLRRRVSFPVRSNFFYEGPLGLFLCIIATGGSMFPPFFRAAEKKAMNRVSLEILLTKLRTPGQMIGFHPEGTRNKTADPYALLPAQPGAGELALKARPLVVPAFILGMSNGFWAELKANLRGESPVTAVFGAPVELPETPPETRLSHHKRCADLINQRIAELGEQVRGLRGEQRITSGSSPPASPDPPAT
ncbi:MAG TPA: lysophospholipid acyltransferase family protein [Myxococcales bacterium]|jgi:1-acyl-sn-glycerol-3-phosphate acyltransferase|nr:lysophospholipid acyltransferase family protein [Myxococcales bacterium]